MYREPDHTDRRAQAAAAKEAMLARFKPKEAVQASEVVPWDEREAERIRGLVARPRKPKATYERPEFAPEPVVVAFEPKATVARSEPIRFSVCESVEFEQVIRIDPQPTGRSKSRAKAWKKAQWKAGNRSCFYCAKELVRLGIKGITPQHPRLATVDHREPLARGGDDSPANYAMCCSYCNNWKADMTEGEFRALLKAASDLSAPEASTANRKALPALQERYNAILEGGL